MKSEMSALYNKTTIYRSGNYKEYSYKNIIVVKDEKDRTVCLDAKKDVEIRQAILDAKRFLNVFGFERLPLKFNNIEIMVYNCSDEKILIKNYLREFDEFRKRMLSTSFI